MGCLVFILFYILQNIYSLGARSFWVHNTGPIGCLPFVLTAFSSAEKDSAGCSKPHNEVAQYFNLKLKEAVAQHRNEFPSAAFTYVDIYSVKYSLFAEPQKHGMPLDCITFTDFFVKNKGLYGLVYI